MLPNLRPATLYCVTRGCFDFPVYAGHCAFHMTPAMTDAYITSLVEDDAPAVREARTADAREARATLSLCRIDHYVRRQDVPAIRADLILAGGSLEGLLKASLAPPARRNPSRAERREATRLVDKQRVRKPRVGKRTQIGMIKLQRERAALIAEGKETAHLTRAAENYCTPTRSTGTGEVRQTLAERDVILTHRQSFPVGTLRPAYRPLYSCEDITPFVSTW